MRGFTRKRGRSWTALWDGPVKVDPDTGAIKRSQKSKGGFRTQKEAQAFLNETLPRVAAGTYIEASAEPLLSFMLGWLNRIESNAEVKSGTSARYRQLVRQYIEPRDIGSVPLGRLTPTQISGLYAELERCSDPKCKHEAPEKCTGLAAGTRRLLHAALRRALNDAVGLELLTRNPAARIKAPRVADTRVTSWTAGELRRFLAHVEHDRLSALWRLAATTGMRRGELLGAQWQTVDLDAATLRVERQLHPAGVGVKFGTPKSKRGQRTIALDAGTVQALRDHRDRQMLEQTLAGDAYQHGQDLVFCNELGAPIRPEWLTREFPKLRSAAKIPVGSLHVLRHTAATLALTAGVPLHVVAARLGDHPQTLLSTYAHLLPHSDVMAADAIAAALGDRVA
jgi:integrase